MSISETVTPLPDLPFAINMEQHTFSALLTNSDPAFVAIANKVMNKERISDADALWLYEHGELSALGVLANLVRERLNGN